MIQLSHSASNDLELDEADWQYDDPTGNYSDDHGDWNPRHAAARRTFEPIRRQARAAMPVGTSLAQSRAFRKGRARGKVGRKHLLFDGKHNRRRTKSSSGANALSVQ